MKKLTALLLALVITLSACLFLSSCTPGKGSQNENSEQAETETTETTTAASKYESLEEACEATGYKVKIPEEIKPTGYSVASGSIIQIDFEGGYLRKGKQNGDISGDREIYDKEVVKSIGSHAVTMKGNNGLVMLAVWAAHDYSYAYCIKIEDGVKESEMVDYIKSFE